MADRKKDNKLAISGKRGDVFFPPSVAVLGAKNVKPNEHANSVRKDEVHYDNSLADIRTEDLTKSGSSNFGALDGGDYSLLSMDDLSIQTDQESFPSGNSGLAVSCDNSETDLNTLTSCLYNYPDETAEAAPVENLQHQPQGDYGGHLSQPHRQDSSPHESMEQGNPTCVATSPSICKNQVIYRREVNYRFPEMEKYETRLQTFQQLHWQLKSPSAEKLAKANMFYEGRRKISLGGIEQVIEDQVVCFKCGHTFWAWQENDDPKKEHMKEKPECFKTKYRDEM